MAESGGYWDSLEECAKATQSTLIPGVVEEDILKNPPLASVPVQQATGTGTSIKWLRQGTLDIASVADFDIGEELLWTKGGNYTPVETSLKRCYKAIKLDNFVQEIHKTVNNYEEMAMGECENLVMRKLNMKYLYDDAVYGSAKQFNGLHALAALNDTGAAADGILDIDNGEAGFSLWNLRTAIDNMKYGVDEILMPTIIFRYFCQAYEERGFAALATGTAGNLSLITRDAAEIGKPITYRFNGVKITPTDFLLPEQVNTGRGTTLRALWSSGTVGYSVFLLKYGSILAPSGPKKNPGMSLGFGNTKGMGDFFKLDVFDKLPNYDAKGIRLINYSAPLLGSKLCLTRIHDITAAAITV